MFRAIRIAIAAVVVAGSFAAVAEATVSPTGPVTLTATTGVNLLGRWPAPAAEAWRRSSTPTR